MLRTLKFVALGCGFLLLLLALVAGGLVVGLNTGAGRQFATAEINRFAGPQIAISGLGGHFPADLKLASLRLKDGRGTWLTGDDLELRWQPEALLRHDLHVTALTAARLTILRPPAPAASRAGAGGSSGTFPAVSVQLDHLAVPELALGPAIAGPIAGRAITLDVTGAARLPQLQNLNLLNLQDLSQGSATLNATTPQGADYRLAAALDRQQHADDAACGRAQQRADRPDRRAANPRPAEPRPLFGRAA